MREGDFEETLDRFLFYREKKEKGEEDKKTYGDVFDRRTLLAFYKLLKRSVEYVEFPISTGKEAMVFRAVGKNGEYLAVKTYLLTRLNYKGLSRFIDGDERFANVHKTKANIIFIWARKEHRNLATFADHGVRVPKPVDVWKNIIVMDYIGDETRPAPLMKEVMESLKKDVIYDILAEMKKMLRAELIHGDLSEYNILIWDDKPWIIDVGQAVPVNHPLSTQLLARDVRNFVNLAAKFGVKFTPEEVLRELEVM